MGFASRAWAGGVVLGPEVTLWKLRISHSFRVPKVTFLLCLGLCKGTSPGLRVQVIEDLEPGSREMNVFCLRGMLQVYTFL